MDHIVGFCFTVDFLANGGKGAASWIDGKVV